MFQGDEICTAFDIAKRAVGFKIREAEAKMFLMLLAEDKDNDIFNTSKKRYKHQCTSLPQFEEGKWKCMSEHNIVKILPYKLEKLIFRDKDMSKLLKMLLEDKERIVNSFVCAFPCNSEASLK